MKRKSIKCKSISAGGRRELQNQQKRVVTTSYFVLYFFFRCVQLRPSRSPQQLISNRLCLWICPNQLKISSKQHAQFEHRMANYVQNTWLEHNFQAQKKYSKYKQTEFAEQSKSIDFFWHSNWNAYHFCGIAFICLVVSRKHWITECFFLSGKHVARHKCALKNKHTALINIDIVCVSYWNL